jgi:hypothetical protein
MSQMYGTAIDQHQPPKAPRAAARLPMTPARRVVLLLGVPLCLLFTVATAFSLVSDVGTGTVGVGYEFPAGASRVAVTTSGGDLTLRQTPTGAATGPGTRTGAATLTGTGYYSLVRPHITRIRTADTAYFDYKCATIFGNCGLNGTLSVPRGTAVTVSTDGGNVTASGVTGDITLSTGGGNIRAGSVTALHVVADTGGGDVDITFTAVPRDVRVSTGGGNITIVVPPGDTAYHVTASAGGGNVYDSAINKADTSPNVITATTGGGDITILRAS